ncbi:DUF1192 family protein [Rhodospirillum sp. A1_3_36]|uniref:DUF1192 family protein n=1 Tax=Rhodospirillum sp. A1_3_36 TaxID=3391666 RepID=UPI0039A5CC4D
MDTEDLEPRASKDSNQALQRPLDDLTIADLEDYISELEAEIARVRAKIHSKGGAIAAADAFFKR